MSRCGFIACDILADMTDKPLSAEKGRISHEPDYEEAWICLCGNTPTDSGFFPCNEAGVEIEPTEKDGWDDLYVCAGCGRIVNQTTLEVLGIADRIDAGR